MRTPYFLYAAFAVPVIDIIALLLACLIAGLRHPPSAGGNVGNYDLSGLGVIIVCAGVSTVAGLIFSVISIIRNERARQLAVLCLIIYFLPVVWTVTQVLHFELGKARLERFEEAQKDKP